MHLAQPDGNLSYQLGIEHSVTLSYSIKKDFVHGT